MKQLTCELCGSTDLVKQDGVFVCQSCGTKYSVEEAKKMMIEGTVNVTGTVQIDDSSKKTELVNSYLKIAKAAVESKDIVSVLDYCNKIIEIDSTNLEAWILKAKFEWNGSTLINLKFAQSLTAANRAIEIAPNDNKYEIAEEIYWQIKSGIVQMLIIAQRLPILTCGTQIVNVMKTWLSILNGIPYLSKTILEKEILDCKTLCVDSKSALSTNARKVYTAYYVDNNKVSFDAMFQKELDEKIAFEDKRKVEFDKAKRDKYWENHADEKRNLEERKHNAELRLDHLINNSDLPKIEQEIRNNIDMLIKESVNLSIFKGKEKKEIESKIEILNNKLNSEKQKFDNEKLVIQNEIDEINVELNKNR